MPKLLELLKNNRLTLIVNLPVNNCIFAAAAVEAGADAISLSVTSLDQYKEQKQEILDIIEQASVPVGILLNSLKSFKVAELSELVKEGIDFIGVAIKKIPKALSAQKEIVQVYVLDSDYTIDEIMNIEKKEGVILEAQVVKRFDAGKDLNVGDLQNYITMTTSTELPIVIQTQKKIHASEIPVIWDTGVKGIEVTSVVVGKTVKTMRKSIHAYRVAIDGLG